MKYREYEPPKALSNVILQYWQFEIPVDSPHTFPYLHETLPDASLSIVLINQPYFTGIRFLGPHIKKFQQPVWNNSIYLGIRFQPWVGIPKWVPEKSNLLNTTAECPSHFTKYFSGIVNKFFAPGFIPGETFDQTVKSFFSSEQIEQNNLIKFICLQVRIGKSIGEIIAEIPLSERVVQKKFKSFTGMTMKQYASIIRQRNTWSELLQPEKDTLDAIYNNGYFDHSHFIRDFRRLMQRSHKGFHKNIDYKLE